MAFAARRGRAPPELRDRLRLLSDRFRGPQAIALRRQPIPHAYRVFFRHIGLDPDEHRIPVEALALERMKHGGFKSRNLLDDAITIAVMETVGAGVGARRRRGRRARCACAPASARATCDCPAGGSWSPTTRGPLAVLFGDVAAGAGVTPHTREMVLFSVAVPGVPPIHVEEALWTVWDIVAGD